MGLSVRCATLEDAHRLWVWRNDPVTCAMSLSAEPVPWENHSAWFAKALLDQSKLILIGLQETVPCGMVRFDRSENGATVSINVSPAFRGQRVSQALLSAAVAQFLQCWKEPLYATVKNENLAMHRCFLGAGFSLQQRDALCSYYSLKEAK